MIFINLHVWFLLLFALLSLVCLDVIGDAIVIVCLNLILLVLSDDLLAYCEQSVKQWYLGARKICWLEMAVFIILASF